MTDQELQTLIAKEADQRGWDQQTQDRMFRDASEIIKAAKSGQDPKAAAGGS